MYDENVAYEMSELNTEDKVRLIMINSFSSKLFLWISIIYSITFVIAFISSVISGFGFESIINLIIPFLLLIGVWKTYNMAISGSGIDTSGLRLIRGCMTFLLVIISILTGLILLLALIGGLILFLIAIPLFLVCFAYYSFRTTLGNIISSFEDGNSNTDYYSATMIFLGITAAFTIIMNVFLYTFDPSVIPNVTPDLIDQFQFTKDQFIFAMFSSFVSLASTILIFYFVYKLKRDLENVHMDYGYDNLDYKISKDVINSDMEIDDRKKYDE